MMTTNALLCRVRMLIGGISWVFIKVLKAETLAKYSCKLLVYFARVCAKPCQRIRKLNTVGFLLFFKHSKVLFDCLNDHP